MKTIISMFIIAMSMIACNSTKEMTAKEKKLITEETKDIPFRVLQIDNKKDSLFLRKKCSDINIKDITSSEVLKDFIERLKLTMAVESGVGIAAPQVGIGRNMFLFMRLDKPGIPVEVAINPRIVNHPEETICFENDGCLSVPDMSGNSKRYAWVDVEYYNEKGDLIKERLSGHTRKGDFTGVVFQHEYDHLQGILYIDKLFE
ncbi:peptide deformylase [Dysgonomonas sp. BGC7]|uniref:peptide deformylase n=1 Tax=Dysgonomonas sp. BGC7 TaxID=1658008 RepID=UPI000A988D5D|nr:peptide deformylase [Dysgonomonas sp. BGC7]